MNFVSYQNQSFHIKQKINLRPKKKKKIHAAFVKTVTLKTHFEIGNPVYPILAIVG